MKTIQEIRRQNLELLFQEFPPAELARRCNTTPSYLSQIRTQFRNRNGQVAVVGTALARKIEAGMDKPLGWMDAVHDEAAAPDSELIELYGRMNDEMRELLLNHARLMVKMKKET